MRLLGRRAHDDDGDRRRPENAERRRVTDDLQAQATLAEKLLAEHRLERSRQKADELGPRLRMLQIQARVMRRQR